MDVLWCGQQLRIYLLRKKSDTDEVLWNKVYLNLEIFFQMYIALLNINPAEFMQMLVPL